MTFGAGGHSRAFLEVSPDSSVLALDRDPLAYRLAQELEDEMKGKVTALNGHFSELPQLLGKVKVRPGSLDAVLMDLGVSSMQLDTSQRGFSISLDGPLDMRMDADWFA
ncbi:hypothetical protein DPMN_011879 [Dreissena polymorpha]|uniref:16S rRNA (Cytosine(1402)-N(4))-methyltransferase n=1 Tax=Dreissena polymorpha TaxID=45954 RepID=A0A9D4N1D5_DREPO|nr:hypothetical protein DPMN_011879 [Dreissena polymorpha]